MGSCTSNRRTAEIRHQPHAAAHAGAFIADAPYVPYNDGMHKTTLYLEDEIRERIARVAKATGRSQADVIRDALRTVFLRRKKPRSIGLGKGGRDLSDRAEDLLEGFGET